MNMYLDVLCMRGVGFTAYKVRPKIYQECLLSSNQHVRGFHAPKLHKEHHYKSWNQNKLKIFCKQCCKVRNISLARRIPALFELFFISLAQLAFRNHFTSFYATTISSSSCARMPISGSFCDRRFHPYLWRPWNTSSFVNFYCWT